MLADRCREVQLLGDVYQVRLKQEWPWDDESAMTV